MKMQEVNMELLAFDSTDVITTSGIATDTNASGIPIIWLTKESVANYNNFDTFDDNLQKSTRHPFLAYSGAFNEDGLFQIASTADEEPDVFNIMDAGDAEMYRQISLWLNSHKTEI